MVAAPFREVLVPSAEECTAGWNGWAYETWHSPPESADDACTSVHAELEQRATEWCTARKKEVRCTQGQVE